MSAEARRGYFLVDVEKYELRCWGHNNRAIWRLTLDCGHRQRRSEPMSSPYAIDLPPLSVRCYECDGREVPKGKRL